MSFEYGCFISYRHLPRIESFVRKLAESINHEMAYFVDKGCLPVFLDEERIKPGDNFNIKIPSVLCKSIVMVVVYVPTYFSKDKTYCTRELVAFLEHEGRRLDEIKQKHPDADHSQMYQVITLVMRKDESKPLPEVLTKDRNLVDWSANKNTALTNLSQFSESSDYTDLVREIVDKIRLIWKLAPQLDVLADCSQHPNLPPDTHPLFQKLIDDHLPAFP